MEVKIVKRKVKFKKRTLWQHYRHFERFVERLDRMADAREVSRNIPRSAPASLVEMLF